MDNFLNYLVYVLLVVLGATAVLYFLIGFLVSYRRVDCPACGKKTLRCVQWIRATVLVEGKKVPESWSYFLCSACDARFKRGRDAIFVAPSEMEWRRYCAAKW